MRILFLTQWFDPEPFFKGLPFARALKDRGHDIQVLTGFPNYPGGKVYPGYRVRVFQREIMEGIPVTRVALYPSHDRSPIRRILNYCSFAISASILGPLLIGKVDVIYAYHPPGTIGLPALVMKFVKKAPVVYDIQDLWPDSVEASGMMNNKIVSWLIGGWCHLIYRLVNKIVVLSPGLKNALIERGVDKKKIEVIYNWCDDVEIICEQENLDPSDQEVFAGRFNIVFAGTMGTGQGLEAVIDAAEILKARQQEIQFVFIGGGTEVSNLRKRAKSKNLDNVIFLDKRPVSEIGKILKAADVLLVHLRDKPLYRIVIPSKTQAYMAVGKPILMCVRGDAEMLVRKAGAGVCCIPEDPQSIAEGAYELYLMPIEELAEMGINGKKYYEEELCMPEGVAMFEKIFRDVLTQEKR